MNVEETFNWLMRNCSYFRSEITLSELEVMVSNYRKDPIPLEVQVSYVAPFHVELEAFEAYLGEKYSFQKHAIPLIKKGLITCVGYAHMDTHERRLWDSHLGCVGDYNPERSYFCFWVGNKDPNEI